MGFLSDNIQTTIYSMSSLIQDFSSFLYKFQELLRLQMQTAYRVGDKALAQKIMERLLPGNSVFDSFGHNADVLINVVCVSY
jgi:hypothetical protein